jgi:hypothetical protein
MPGDSSIASTGNVFPYGFLNVRVVQNSRSRHTDRVLSPLRRLAAAVRQQAPSAGTQSSSFQERPGRPLRVTWLWAWATSASPNWYCSARFRGDTSRSVAGGDCEPCAAQSPRAKRRSVCAGPAHFQRRGIGQRLVNGKAASPSRASPEDVASPPIAVYAVACTQYASFPRPVADVLLFPQSA